MNVFIGTLLMIIGAVASNPISKALPGRPAKMAATDQRWSAISASPP